MDTLLSDTRHPLEQLLIEELNKYVDTAIEHLPEATRNVYLMSHDQHMTYQEIADRLGISINTVKYHIKNAHRRLSADMAHYALSLTILYCHFGHII